MMAHNMTTLEQNLDPTNDGYKLGLHWVPMVSKMHYQLHTKKLAGRWINVGPA